MFSDLPIWLGHSAHLLISLNDRMRGLNKRMLAGLGNVLICFNPVLAWFPALLIYDNDSNNYYHHKCYYLVFAGILL